MDQAERKQKLLELKAEFADLEIVRRSMQRQFEAYTRRQVEIEQSIVALANELKAEDTKPEAPEPERE